MLFFHVFLNALGESPLLWHYRHEIKGLCMKQGLIYFLFLLAASKVFAGDTDNVCDRGVIGVEIAKAVSASDCSQVSKADMAKLEYLVVANKNITVLKAGSFLGLSSLKSLFIDSNRIQSIEAAAFKGLDSLLVLKLDRNKISKIDSSVFKDLISLRALDLSFNRLEEVGGISQLLALEEISLEFNLLATLPQFAGGESLRSVNLKNNRLEKIQREKVLNLKSLRSIDFENNLIADIEGEAFAQTSLIQMNLRNNRLEQIQSNWFSNLPSLQTLTLDANAIQFVEEGSFQGSEALESLELHANPLREISRGRAGLSPQVYIGGVRIIP